MQSLFDGVGHPYQSPLPSPRVRELVLSPLTLAAAAEAKLDVNGDGIAVDGE